MKKVVSFFLCIVLIISILPVKAVEENSSVKVMIPCQYAVGHEISQTVIPGEIKDDILYVDIETIADITGSWYVKEDDNIIIIPPFQERTRTALTLNTKTRELTEVSAGYAEESFNIPIMLSTAGDSVSVSFTDMLSVLNAEINYLQSDSIPLSIYTRETILSAREQFLFNDFYFSWTEVDPTLSEEKIGEKYIWSSLWSLIFDYDEHFYKDAMFSWVSDDILDVKEEQYQDSMIKTLTCFSDIDDISLYEDINYESFSFTSDSISLTSGLLELLDIDKEFEKAASRVSAAYDFTGVLIDWANVYCQLINITDTQSNILRSTFLSGRENPELRDDPRIQNAAQHLQNLISQNEVGAKTVAQDMTLDFIVQGLDTFILSKIPLYAMIDATVMLSTLFPAVDDFSKSNRATNLAITSCYLGCIAGLENTTVWTDMGSNFLDSQKLHDFKSTFIYLLQSIYTTRDLIIRDHSFSEEKLPLATIQNLREKNAELASFINYAMTCSTQWREPQELDAAAIDDIISRYQDVYSAYHATEQLNHFTVHQKGNMSNSPMEERGSDSSYAWDSTYYVKDYSTDSMFSSGESHQTRTSSGTNRFTQESYATTMEQDFSFTYGNAVLHGTEEYNGTEYPFTSALSPEEFLDLQLPDISDITSIEVSSDDSYTTVQFFVDASSITEESAHILNHIIEPVSMQNTSINWFEDPNNPSGSGFDDASITMTLDKDGALDSILIDFIANIAIQDYVKVEGSVTFRFEPLDESKLQEVSFSPDPELFSRIPQTYTFSSGAGGWATILTINEDGTFAGEYHDSDMGNTGSNYPNGTVQICEFSGKFSTPLKIDSYTYFTRLESIELKNEPGTEYYEEGTRFINSEPYGFDNANGFLIYMPGAPIASLPEGFLSWSGLDTRIRTTTPSGYYGLYNVGGQEGFTALEDNTIWNQSYAYTYGTSRSVLLPSYYSVSHLTFWPDSDGAATIILTFNWETDDQTQFNAVDTISGGAYTISIDMSEDNSRATVSVQSEDKTSFLTWNGTIDGTLVAEYIRE